MTLPQTITLFLRKLPIECTLWNGKNRKDLQDGQVVILLPSKDSNPNISDAKVCRISRKIKTKYRRTINYDLKYQELKVENGTLKGTGSFLKFSPIVVVVIYGVYSIIKQKAFEEPHHVD